MYHHVKKLMFAVRVDEPDPRFGNMLLEQFGGANGELAAGTAVAVKSVNLISCFRHCDRSQRM